jgi:hypothetical protein
VAGTKQGVLTRHRNGSPGNAEGPAQQAPSSKLCGGADPSQTRAVFLKSMPPQQGTSETGGRIDRNRNGRRMRSVVGQSLWSVTSGKCWASSSCSKTTSSCWRCKREARARNAQTQLSEPAPERGAHMLRTVATGACLHGTESLSQCLSYSPPEAKAVRPLSASSVTIGS